MSKIIEVSLREEGIVSFFKRVAEELNYKVTPSMKFDNNEIMVSVERFETISKHYKQFDGFDNCWKNYGPEINEDLQGKEVLVGKYFIQRRKTVVSK